MASGTLTCLRIVKRCSEIVGTVIIVIMSHLGAGADIQGNAAPKEGSCLSSATAEARHDQVQPRGAVISSTRLVDVWVKVYEMWNLCHFASFRRMIDEEEGRTRRRRAGRSVESGGSQRTRDESRGR